MKKNIRIILLIIAALFIVWNVILIKFTPGPGESSRYKESDFLSYYWFTDNLIKNAPRISNHYQFEYWELDGSSPRMSIIEYHDATDADALRDYLNHMKFNKKKTDSHGERWEKKNTGTVYINEAKGEKVIILSLLTYP